jgi:predicted O-methyltransferase YrrM
MTAVHQVTEEDVIKLALAVPGMMREEELRFLWRLAMQAQAGSQFVELGTYLGRTLVVLGHVAQRRGKYLTSIDDYSYDERCSCAKVRENLIAAGLAAALDSAQIVLIEGDSRQKPAELVDIGLLFVDSDHFSTQFDQEMTAWLGSVRPGGVIVCHDYDSPTWLEMTGAIQRWLFTPQFARLGLVRRLIGFRKLT